MSESKRINGTVKWFDKARGFGFIINSEIAYDIFVHFSEVPKCKKIGTRRLLEGQQVSFKLKDNGQRGKKACSVIVQSPLYC